MHSPIEVLGDDGGVSNGRMRIVSSVGLLVAIAVPFWTWSRVPALRTKANLGTGNTLSGLGFEPLVDTTGVDNRIWLIALDTVNWWHTNLHGMAFGILFGAGVLTLLRSLPKRNFEHPIANSIMGTVLGAPLGVCVNCAAPIAQGAVVGGLRAETALAMMMSSPTLNVIVLTMLLAMLPFWMVGLKIAVTVVVLVVGVPLAVRLGGSARIAAPEPPELFELPDLQTVQAGTLVVARSVLGDFWSGLKFVVVRTVPLMLLAGFLGAVVVNVVPLQTLADVLPNRGAIAIIAAIGAVAVLGTALPVPMAFDVVIVAILFEAGLPGRYAAALLVTLGLFSMFAAAITWQSMAPSTALLVTAGVIVAGIVSGLAGHVIVGRLQSQNQELVAEALSAIDRPLHTVAHTPSSSGVGSAEVLPVPFGPVDAGPGLAVTGAPFVVVEDAAGATRFELVIGDEIGLDNPYEWSLDKTIPPFAQFRSLTAGDIDGDGWVDIVVSSERGVHPFRNLGGTFQPMGIVPNELDGRFVVNTALVDLDADGDLDLFAATHLDGNWVMWNDDGVLRSAESLPGLDGTGMTAAVAFADFDGNGRVDVVLGNWTGGRYTRNRAFGSSTNAVLLNHSSGFDVHVLPGTPGETLSVLATDLDGDGHVDIGVGNDFAPPDDFLFGRGDGTFIREPRGGRVPASTTTTMSLHTGDLDNDLVPEFFAAQITDSATDLVADAGLCDALPERHLRGCAMLDGVHRTVIDGRLSFAACETLATVELREDCIGVNALRSIASSDLCADLPRRWTGLTHSCEVRQRSTVEPDPDEGLPSVPARNVLLSLGEEQFHDRTEQWGVEVAGWAWNAKFSDFDNDGWLDLYVANGHLVTSGTLEQPNELFWNQGGQGFVVDEVEPTRVHMPTSSWVSLDFDRDGDLDIVAAPSVGPLHVFMNRSLGNAIAVSFCPEHSLVVGTRVVVQHVGALGDHQLREVQAGGGFISSDAPIAWFGVGDLAEVDALEIRWPSGEVDRIEGPLETEHEYRVC